MDQEARRRELYALLGDLPPRDRPIHGETVSAEEHDGYVLETIRLDLNGLEDVPAYLARPKDPSAPTAAILYNHAHGNRYEIGKEELVRGREGLQSPPYAEVLTGMGYTVLCIDAWNFGERRGRTESELFKEMLWHGRVLWGWMVYDSLRAVDYLVSRSEVDARRLGTMGISMGSTMAWWVAALDPRIRVTIDLCCLTDFQSLIEARGLDGHGIYYYVPGLLKRFTTAGINALIAPRPHLSLAGNHDPLTPREGLDRVDRELQGVYRSMNAPDAWRLFRSDTGHCETRAMRQEVLAFLQSWM